MKFKTMPVVILPDDSVEYKPGDPLPPGATINTPIPALVFVVIGIVMVSLSAWIVKSVIELVQPPAGASHITASPPTLSPPLISFGLITFTPASSPRATRTAVATPTPKLVPISPTAAGPASVEIVPARARSGEIVVAMVTSQIAGMVMISWNGQPILSSPISRGGTGFNFPIPPARPGFYMLSFDVGSAASAVHIEKQFEVIP
jgi:hypothetical protein